MKLRLVYVVVAVVSLTLPAWAAVPNLNCSASNGVITCSTSGSGTYSFNVPYGVTAISVTAKGASGGRGTNGNYPNIGSPGGAGGAVSATVPVNGGENLQLLAGGAGGNVTLDTRYRPAMQIPGVGGFNGGASGGVWGGSSTTSGGGGGASSFLVNGTQVVVAGGGGGGAGYSSGAGGKGGDGGQVGLAGDRGAYLSYWGDGGKGGTQSAGGAGGAANAYTTSQGEGTHAGSNGTTGAGGEGGSGGHGDAGGGGAGGYFGGGGGGAGYTAGGGGGGSSYADPNATNVSYQTGVQGGDGVITFSFAQSAATVVVTADKQTSKYGEWVRLSAQVVPEEASAGASVTFRDNGEDIATTPYFSYGQTWYPYPWLNAGTHVISVAYNGNGTYLPSVGTLAGGLTVSKAPSTMSWPAPSPITYGTPLGSAQLNASATFIAADSPRDVPGTFVYTPAPGTLVDAGTAQPLSVTFTPNDTGNNESATASVAIDVNKANPAITWATPAGIAYGTLLSATQLNASVAGGATTYTPPIGTLLGVGDHQALQLDVAANSNYNAGTRTVYLNVGKGAQTINWSAPAGITYGTALSATQLNASASGSGPAAIGAMSYSPASGAILGAGAAQTLTVNLAATNDYNAATATVPIDVAKAIQTITWTNPAPIIYGTALGSQLNATASSPGSFTYTPPPGTILDAGTAQKLSVAFSPSDGNNLAGATADVFIDVDKAKPTITWATPADIPYGTLLSATQLNASVSGNGTRTYTPSAGALLAVGVHQSLEVDVAASANYIAATGTVYLNVGKGTQTISWSAPAGITYGTALSGTQLNASGSGSGPAAIGGISYSPASGSVLGAGAQTLTVNIAATDDYNAATASRPIDVAKANQTINWSNPAPIVYGNPLGAQQLNAGVSVAGPAAAGSVTYVPASGTVLNAGANQTLTVNAAATDNYNAASSNVSIDVTRAPLTITPRDTSRKFGDANPTFIPSFDGLLGSDGPSSLTTAPAFATNATTSSTVGDYVVTASGAVAPNYTIAYAPGKLTIRKATPAITIASASGQYSDAVNLTSQLSPATLGGRAATGTVTFSIDGTSAGSTAVDGSGASSLQHTINRVTGDYPTRAVFVSSDLNFADATSTDAHLVVTPEDALATYNGPTFATTANVIYVPLHADIRDSADGKAGDLHNARVSFVDRDTNQVIASNLPVTFTGSNFMLGAVDFSWPVTVNPTPSKKSDGSNSKSVTVATVVGGSYVRNATTDDTIVMVAETASKIVSGGGYLNMTTPGGSMAPDLNSRLNFSFNVTYKGGGTVNGGFIRMIVRSGGKVLRFRGTPSTINGSTGSGRTSVIGSGELVDITNPATPLPLGTFQVQIDSTDRGASSLVGITVTNGASVLISSNGNGIAQPQLIASGGLQVH